MPIYPIRNNRFKLEIDGLEVASFSEVSGFDASVDVVEYREGDQAPTPRKLPGLTKYGNITLKKGTYESPVLFEWLKGISDGSKLEHKVITLTALLEDGANSSISWQIMNAWPVRYQAPDFNGTSNDVAIETVEIAHEGMKRNS